jgi:hypothetical protein
MSGIKLGVFNDARGATGVIGLGNRQHAIESE